ncbi:hypothetical protein BH09BAC1_BH09BAC1_21990 [soil metagenome]
MAKNITPKHQQEFMTGFQTYLNELAYIASLSDVDAGDGHTYTNLNVIVDITSEQLPDEDNQIQMETAFLPQLEDDMDGSSILQMMTPILVADEKVDKGELFSLIIKLNTFMPMGAFGYWEEQNLVYHKQNNIVGKTLSEEVFASLEEQIGTIQYVLMSFVPSLAAVAIDGAKMKEALENNPFAKVFSE